MFKEGIIILQHYVYQLNMSSMKNSCSQAILVIPVQVSLMPTSK